MLRWLRYSLSLIDTVKITPEKAVCLTEGIKTAKEFLFFFVRISCPSVLISEMEIHQG